MFLEVLRERPPEFGNGARPALVCVLPRGASPEQRFDIEGAPLEVHTNRLARFQAYYSARHDGCKAGDIVNWHEEEFHPLPPLETIINVDPAFGKTFNTLPVKLIASANQLGLLHVSCVSTDHRVKQSWPLEFSLRPHENDRQPLQTAAVSKVSVELKPNVTAAALEAARLHIQHSFARSANQRDLITATRVVKKLEQILGIAKSEWNAGLVRSLWPALESCMARRKTSPDHEEAWLILAGFLLRPGFGAAGDDLRIDSLWGLRNQGLYFLGKRSKCQEYILWRRVAGGLTQRLQEQILAPELEQDPDAQEATTGTYPARGITRTPSQPNEDGIGQPVH